MQEEQEQEKPAESEQEKPAPKPKPESGGGKSTEPIRLPDDHPLVTAYGSVKDELAQTKSRVKEFEDADKSENERLAEALKEAQADGTTTKAELARMRAAVKHGLSEDDLELLGTGTPEEIEARAEKLAERLGSSASRPVRALGKDGGETGTDVEALVNSIPPTA